VAILGAGQFGFALAYLLGSKSQTLDIMVYDPIKEYIESIQNSRSHPVFHKGVVLTKNVTATNSLSEAITGAQVIVLAVPGQFIRGSVKDWAPLVKNDVVVLNVSKALEKGTNTPLHEVVMQEWAKIPHTTELHFAALAGGMLAEEVSRGDPICADIACESVESAQKLRLLFETPLVKINVMTDVLGLELAGAFKNVIAIAAGAFDGLGLAVSSKCAYISMCAKECKRLAIILGAKSETFQMGGQAWLGDVLTTCFGPGRNRLFGEFIGSGLSVEDALKKLHEQKKISEGYLTTKAFYELTVEKNIEAPFLKNIYQMLFEGKPALKTCHDFFVLNQLS